MSMSPTTPSRNHHTESSTLQITFLTHDFKTEWLNVRIQCTFMQAESIALRRREGRLAALANVTLLRDVDPKNFVEKASWLEHPRAIASDNIYQRAQTGGTMTIQHDFRNNDDMHNSGIDKRVVYRMGHPILLIMPVLSTPTEQSDRTKGIYQILPLIRNAACAEQGDSKRSKKYDDVHVEVLNVYVHPGGLKTRTMVPSDRDEITTWTRLHSRIFAVFDHLDWLTVDLLWQRPSRINGHNPNPFKATIVITISDANNDVWLAVDKCAERSGILGPKVNATSYADLNLGASISTDVSVGSGMRGGRLRLTTKYGRDLGLFGLTHYHVLGCNPAFPAVYEPLSPNSGIIAPIHNIEVLSPSNEDHTKFVETLENDLNTVESKTAAEEDYHQVRQPTLIAKGGCGEMCL
ncbi:hypothetical protein K470DRAFT_262356 [Piedraia hortae CBS 480.64]|uniref:Uncharacterized protein n=1 Tax=Piedraia hortae CBS 480.64 TaxID=1314780 RepID=A0A6A7C6V5_9PEZI|nr:hypothetical protein K470DRAFT_262356 [Piedraia hortae CBS 480.64]